MIYLYAITEAAPVLGGGPAGVEGAEVTALTRGSLAAVHSPLPAGAAPAPTPDAFWAHEQVVEALMRDRPVLPVQFGMTLAGEGELERLLDDRGQAFTEQLAAVRGCVELSVRVGWTPAPGIVPDPAETGSGRRYLEARVQDGRQAGAATEAVHPPLANLARSSTCSAASGARLSAAYLVASSDVAAFTGRLEAIRDAHPTLDLSCTGPWPPYSFVGAR